MTAFGAHHEVEKQEDKYRQMLTQCPVSSAKDRGFKQLICSLVCHWPMTVVAWLAGRLSWYDQGRLIILRCQEGQWHMEKCQLMSFHVLFIYFFFFHYVLEG
jgi:hypothetical protein